MSLSSEDIGHVVEGVGSLWERFRGARIFITGGTGFVGKWLVEPLIAANKKFDLDLHATLLTRDVAKFERDCPQIVGADCIALTQGDIRHFDFPMGSFTHVIHGAADMSVTLDAITTFDIILTGTRRVMEFATKKQASDVLLISSGAVYGVQPPTLSHIREDFDGVPDQGAAYGSGKRAAEGLALAMAAQHGLKCRIARLFAVTGPYLALDGAYAAGNFVRDLLAGRAIEVKGDGTTVRSYLYAADMSVWLWTILAAARRGAAYNVGSEIETSIAALAACIAGLADKQLSVNFGAKPINGRLPDRYVPSTALARSELGLTQTIMLDEGLRCMIASASAGQRQAA